MSSLVAAPRKRQRHGLHPQQIPQPIPVPVGPPAALHQGCGLDLADPFVGDAEFLGDDLQGDAVVLELV
jgi:hypothetical protein